MEIQFSKIQLAAFTAALIALLTTCPSLAVGSNDVYVDCNNKQCLILDFLTKKNRAYSALEQIVGTYGDFIKQPSYGLTSLDFRDKNELCKRLPMTECFSRVITIRQKIYQPTDSSHSIGCLIVGGIQVDKNFGRTYKSFGITYNYINSRWQAIGISSLISLNDIPTFEDLLSDPCPAAK